MKSVARVFVLTTREHNVMHGIITGAPLRQPLQSPSLGN